MKNSGMAAALLIAMAAAASAQSLAPTKPASQDPRLKLVNVQLTADGILEGQVVDEMGSGLSHLSVTCRSKEFVAAATTDEDGRFRIRRTLGGACVLQVGPEWYACRTWRHGTAPPGAISTIALVHAPDSVMRGNRGTECDECSPERVQRLTSEQKYGLAIAALGGAAAYMAFSRDNVASE